MHKRTMALAFSLAACAFGAGAQKTVTTPGGVADTVPVFTGGASVGNSEITQVGGNVGIGTASPAYTLDVNGNANLGGDKTITLTNSISWGGSIPAQLFIPLGEFDQQGQVVIDAKSEGCDLGGTSRFVIPAGYGSGIQVYSLGDNNAYPHSASAFTFYYENVNFYQYYLAVALNGGCPWPSSKSATLTLHTPNWVSLSSTDPNPANYIAEPTNTYLYNGFSGNVGLGTTSPYNLLTVAEDYNGTTDPWPADPGQGQLVVKGTTNPQLAFGIGVDTTNSVVRLQGQNIGISAIPLALNPVAGNVGVGTISPAYRLDVSGQIRSTGGMVFPDGSVQTTAYSQAITGTNAITQSNGNVGIGTSSPAYPLDVNGNVNLGGEKILTVTQNISWSGTEPPQLFIPMGEFDLTGQVMIDATSAGCWLSGTSSFVIPAGYGSGIQVYSMGDSNTYPHAASQFTFYYEIISPTRYYLAAALNGGCPWPSSKSATLTIHTSNFVDLGTTDSNQANYTPEPSLSYLYNGYQGNVGIGTLTPAAKLDVNGSINISGVNGGITFPNGGGTQTVAYTGVTSGGDFAESVDVTGDRAKYEPGDLLVIDPSAPGRFLKANEPYSTLVTGIYSTKPGTVGRRQSTPMSARVAEVPMAMVGIVPAKVCAENGPIRAGDLLVASSTPGYAMKGTDHSKMTGAVIGKALGNLDSGSGIIEVVVTLQ